MNRDEILAILQVTGEPMERECVGVEYSFDFSSRPSSINAQPVYEIGRTDAGIPVVVEPKEGQVFFLDPQRGLSFLNSSFPQLLATFDLVNAWEIPGNISNSEQARMFTERMLEIDERVLQDPETCWSIMREEIENGAM